MEEGKEPMDEAQAIAAQFGGGGMGMSMDMPPGAMGGNPMMMMNMMQQQQPQVNVVEPGLCLYFSRSSFILILFSVNLLLRSAWTTQEPMQERSRGSVLAPPQPPFQSKTNVTASFFEPRS